MLGENERGREACCPPITFEYLNETRAFHFESNEPPLNFIQPLLLQKPYFLWDISYYYYPPARAEGYVEPEFFI